MVSAGAYPMFMRHFGDTEQAVEDSVMVAYTLPSPARVGSFKFATLRVRDVLSCSSLLFAESLLVVYHRFIEFAGNASATSPLCHFLNLRSTFLMQFGFRASVQLSSLRLLSLIMTLKNLLFCCGL